MHTKNLKGLDQDLKRGLDYNRKHGGVSDELKKRMKRPERTDAKIIAMSYPELDKCSVCGKKKFKNQEICYKCYELQCKKIR